MHNQDIISGTKDRERRFFYMEQNTPEWFAIKQGKLSGSSAKILKAESEANIHKIGDGLESMICRRVGEKFTTDEIYDDNSGKAAERGHELEPYAREEYEKRTYSVVGNVGFIQLGDHLGCSPDGLVDEDGMIEIKCLMHTEFTRAMRAIMKIDKAVSEYENTKIKILELSQKFPTTGKMKIGRAGVSIKKLFEANNFEWKRENGQGFIFWNEGGVAQGFKDVEEFESNKSKEYTAEGIEEIIDSTFYCEQEKSLKKRIQRYNDAIIPPMYYCQMQWNLFISGRDWCDYVLFHPDFGKKRLFIKRVKRDNDLIAKFEHKATIFEAEMEETILYLKN